MALLLGTWPASRRKGLWKMNRVIPVQVVVARLFGRAAVVAALFALSSAAALRPAAGATSGSWSSASGSWNVATNWTPNGVPQATGDQASDTLKNSLLILDAS